MNEHSKGGPTCPHIGMRTRGRIGMFALLCVAALQLAGLCESLIADPLDHWHWRTPEGTGRDLRSIAFGDNRFVSVGNGGTIVTSVDGLRWQAVESGAFENLRGVRFLNNQFVAVGELGAVYISMDGFLWAPYLTAYFYDLNDITFGNGLYVAVGDGGVVMTSSDLLTWNARVLGNRPLHGVGFGNGTFVVVGGAMQSEDDIAGIILTSPDGLVWSSRNARGTYSLHGIEFLNGEFLALGGTDFEANGSYYAYSPTLLSSSDGGEWSIRLLSGSFSADGLLTSASFGEGRYMAVANWLDGGSILTASNLNDWEYVTGQVNAAFYGGVVFGNSRFVAVARGGATSVVLDESLSIRRPQSFERYYFTEVEHGQGRFLGLPASVYPDPVVNSVLLSTNGAGWRTQEVIPRIPPVTADDGETVFTNLVLKDLCAGPDKFIAVGGGQLLQTTNGLLASESPFSCILSSPDGENWTLRQWNSPDTNGGWSAVVWNGAQYLAVRPSGGLSGSSNGVDWVSFQSPDWDGRMAQRSLLAGGNWQFVALCPAYGFPGVLPSFLVSEDGIYWSNIAIPTNYHATSVTFGGGRFLAVGEDGLVILSTNGMDWTQHNSLPGASLSSPTWTEGGYAALIYPNRVLLSPDGEEWSVYDPVPGAGYSAFYAGDESIQMFGVAGGDGTLLAWGASFSGGADFVIQSDPLTNKPPVIGVQPTDLLLGIGETRSLGVSVSGSPPLAYQWFKDGAVIPSATHPLLDLVNAQIGDSAGYSVVVSNSFGVVTTRVAQVTVSAPALELTLKHEVRWDWDPYQSPPVGTATHKVIRLAGPVGNQWAIEYRDGLDSTNSWQTLNNVFLWYDVAEIEDSQATNSVFRVYRGRLAD